MSYEDLSKSEIDARHDELQELLNLLGALDTTALRTVSNASDAQLLWMRSGARTMVR